ncbi:MAG: hypothetical protein A2622_04640 [Bdellovibrionales bacterium RIFCSPHIGHO2_01_FULL_40_29]|nr:MAG: hypothetical protein A2622_04640 [Bdellovibrionales bacterium RIFCSPHIGHO2_01_FULL_40_29]OFZ34779.1 MAG: hypothetical protein A3D17_10735 [Bdellovibrionales bacterium RIFCSPHIGHO2_02_FULL_40_15]
MFLFFIVLLFSTVGSAVEMTASLNGQYSDDSRTTTVLINPLFSEKSFSYDFTLYASRAVSKIEYDSTSGQQEFEKSSAGVAVGFQYNNLLGLEIEGFRENVNQAEVLNLGHSSKLKILAEYGYFSFQMADLYIRQNNSFFILNRDIKDQMTLRQKKYAYQIGIDCLNPFFVSISYAQYTYDQDLETFRSILSLPAVILNNNAVFLSEFSNVLDETASLDISYTLSKNFDLELSVGQAIDFLTPFTKSFDTRLGLIYFQKLFSVGGGVQTVKSDDFDDRSYSADLSLNALFD